MTLTKTRAWLLAGLAAPFALATAALAADPPASPSPGHDGMEAMHRHMDDPAVRARMAEHHAQHLRDALQLRADQEGALQAFLASMKPPEGASGALRHEEHEGETALTTPQRLDKMLAHLDEARAHLAAHADAVKRFYAALSPAQQRAFDAMGPMGGGMHMRVRMHMGGGMHGAMAFGGPDGPGVGPMAMGDEDEMYGPGERRVIIMRHGDEPDGDNDDAPPPHN